MQKSDFPLDQMIKVGESKKCEYKIEDLKPNTGYYVTVTATNERGEGYKNEKPQFVMTQSASFSKTSQLYVWGSNTYSEIGLSDDFVNEHKEFYKKTEKDAYLTKPLCHDQF